MELTKENDKLEQQMKSYEVIFDIVRIVDPTKKKIIGYKDHDVVIDVVPCYSLWADNMECKNCISMKALNDQKTYIKIQHTADKMFLMFATPLNVNGGALVLELIKEITDDFVFETVVQGEGNELRNIVEDLNTIILKDALTGLYNKRYIQQMLPEEISRSTNKNPLTIAMIDIDHFKDINDTYGHPVGDKVLKKLAHVLLKLIRDDKDWAARYGGEEFLLCLPNTNSLKAYKIIERIRKAIEKTNIKIEGEKIKITSSFGLYTVYDDKLTAAEIIKNADSNLYQAKNQGRNQVVL